MSENLFLLVLIHQRSQKIVGTSPLHLALTFPKTQNEGVCFRKAKCDTGDTKCDTHDAAFLELFLLNCIFVQNVGTVLLAGFF